VLLDAALTDCGYLTSRVDPDADPIPPGRMGDYDLAADKD
jgi:hypothetical protein